MKSPLITTIIPTYRRPHLLRRAIHSALAQTFTDLQVLVLDNASGDETPEVIAELAKEDPRVKYICQSQNLGATANFQYGLHQVETPFFSLLSDDDILIPDFYATAMQSFTDHPTASFAACGTLHITPTGDYYGMPLAELPAGFYQPPEGLLAILRHGHPEWTAILFRRAILDDIGYLNAETGYASDLDFELRAAARSPYVISHRPGAIFSTQPLTEHASGTYPFDKIWPGWPVMIQELLKNPHISQTVKEEAQWRLESRFRDGLFRLGLRYLYQNKVEDAQKAHRVLKEVYKRSGQAALLRLGIVIHQVIGPKRALTFWNLCRRFGKQAARESNPVGSKSLDVTPYLKYLQVPGKHAL